MPEIRKIAVMTSGGDSPGMNACIRAVARRGEALGLEVVGFERGWEGLVDNQCTTLSERVNSIKHGGTMLKTARSERFFQKEYRETARANLLHHGVDGLLTIGGNGTFRGLRQFLKESDIKGLGIPATIDNDIHGTESIGFDTAVNTAIEAIDRIRDTAGSDERLFLVEVMGRHSGQIALHVGVAGGADEIILPERKVDITALASRLHTMNEQGACSWVVVVSEGSSLGGADQLAEALKVYDPPPLRVCTLGHVQRGGQPTARDRVLGTKLGGAAVDALFRGESDKMVGHREDRIHLTGLGSGCDLPNPLDPILLELLPSIDARRLSGPCPRLRRLVLTGKAGN